MTDTEKALVQGPSLLARLKEWGITFDELYLRVEKESAALFQEQIPVTVLDGDGNEISRLWCPSEEMDFPEFVFETITELI